MATSESNLIAGPVTLYIAPVGEALPELDDLAVSVITITPGGNWRAVGFTEDDQMLNVSDEQQDRRVNESLGIVKVFRTEESGSFSFTMSEKDMRAFADAIAASSLSTVAAGADQTGQDILSYGDGTLVEKSLLILGTNPEGGSRVVHVYRAVQSDEREFQTGHEHKGHEVTWKFLTDTTKTAGERMFKIYDIVDDATS